MPLMISQEFGGAHNIHVASNRRNIQGVHDPQPSTSGTAIEISDSANSDDDANIVNSDTSDSDFCIDDREAPTHLISPTLCKVADRKNVSFE